jgi:hypothetical protein
MGMNTVCTGKRIRFKHPYDNGVTNTGAKMAWRCMDCGHIQFPSKGR